MEKKCTKKIEKTWGKKLSIPNNSTACMYANSKINYYSISNNLGAKLPLFSLIFVVTKNVHTMGYNYGQFFYN